MKRLILTFTVLFLSAPSLAFAQNTSLSNPLPTTDVREIIALIIRAAISVSGSIALLMFVYGGFLWLTSAGNTTQIDKGKKVLLWAVLGIVLIASAYVVVNAIFTGISTGSVNTQPAA